MTVANTILCGDALSELQKLPTGSVHLCVTSPPYFNLRTYSKDPELKVKELGRGSLTLYISGLVQVFREVRRVLHDSGTLILNLGDSMKNKQLLGVPWRTALALQDDGWILRSDMIWAKGVSGKANEFGYHGSVMPGSQKDRFTNSHEYLFMFAKSRKYFFDLEAVKETLSQRTPRTVLTMNTKGYKGAHFAVFPESLPEIFIKCCTSEKGCCSICGSPQVRVVEKHRVATRPATESKTYGSSPEDFGNRDPQRHVTSSKTVGWKPSCSCVSEIVPCIVLDPFAGSGTVMSVAKRLGRSYCGIELNPEYIPLIEERLK